MKFELLKGSRSRILAVVIFAVMAVFVIRLFYLQVIRHDYYVELARAEQQSQFKIPASRGVIYAKSGDDLVQLVMNETVYTVFADPMVVDDKDKVVTVMKEVAGGNVRTGFEELLDKKESRYQIIATKVTRTQAEKIKEHSLHGIGFQAVSQRVYPEGDLAAQVLGFVNTEGVGRYGIEDAMNDELNGKDGLLKTVTDVSNVPLTIGTDNVNQPKQDGKNLVLTIDRSIQSKAEDALAAGLERTGATNGSVLIMNPNNGEILAMANLPTYNPSEYFKVEDIAAFNNATISFPYEPASVMKTYTYATAIDQGVLKPTDTYNNTNTIEVEDREIQNVYKKRTGEITFQEALSLSLNTGSVTAARRLGDGEHITQNARQAMYQYFHDRFGLGELTGVGLTGEAKGQVVSPDEVEGNEVRYSNMTFGQGMNVTMIQVASGLSAIINGGNYYKPVIVDGYVDTAGDYKEAADAPALRTNLVSASTSQTIREMMNVGRHHFFPNIDKAGYFVGGKTGTGQVIVNGQYSTDETSASYLGFGGSDRDHPSYVIMVRLGGEDRILDGEKNAMPIFTDISNWMLEYLKLAPKG
jgi:cell division protein FtsI (penicillin-binding protein 3)